MRINTDSKKRRSLKPPALGRPPITPQPARWPPCRPRCCRHSRCMPPRSRTPPRSYTQQQTPREVSRCAFPLPWKWLPCPADATHTILRTADHPPCRSCSSRSRPVQGTPPNHPPLHSRAALALLEAGAGATTLASGRGAAGALGLGAVATVLAGATGWAGALGARCVLPHGGGWQNVRFSSKPWLLVPHRGGGAAADMADGWKPHQAIDFASRPSPSIQYLSGASTASSRSSPGLRHRCSRSKAPGCSAISALAMYVLPAIQPCAPQPCPAPAQPPPRCCRQLAPCSACGHAVPPSSSTACPARAHRAAYQEQRQGAQEEQRTAPRQGRHPLHRPPAVSGPGREGRAGHRPAARGGVAAYLLAPCP